MELTRVFTALGLLGYLMVSCNQPMQSEDYIQWIRDYRNGLHVKQRTGGFEFDVQYQPADYLRLQRKQSGGLSKAGNQGHEDGLELMQYYTLAIGLSTGDTDLLDHGTEDMESRQRRLYYFSYHFQYDIVLEEGNRRLPCVLFHFEKPADLQGRRTFLLGFERYESDAEEAKLIIDSSQFGSLPVHIRVLKDKIPEVTL